MLRVKLAGLAAGVFSTVAIYHQFIYVRIVDIHAEQTKRLELMEEDLLRVAHEVTQLVATGVEKPS